MENRSIREGDELALREDTIVEQLGVLEGDILTIIDAFTSDEKQNKALKDLVRARFSDRFIFIGKLCDSGQIPLEHDIVDGRRIKVN